MSDFLKYAFFNFITNRETLVASSILMEGMNGWGGGGRERNIGMNEYLLYKFKLF